MAVLSLEEFCLEAIIPLHRVLLFVPRNSLPLVVHQLLHEGLQTALADVLPGALQEVSAGRRYVIADRKQRLMLEAEGFLPAIWRFMDTRLVLLLARPWR